MLSKAEAAKVVTLAYANRATEVTADGLRLFAPVWAQILGEVTYQEASQACIHLIREGDRWPDAGAIRREVLRERHVQSMVERNERRMAATRELERAELERARQPVAGSVRVLGCELTVGEP